MTSWLYLLSIAWVHATVTIKPVSPYTSSTSIFYYAARGVPSPGGFVASGYTNFDLTYGGVSGTRDLDTSNLVWLDISSNTKFTVGSGKQLIVRLLGQVTGSASDLKPFPITAAGAATGTPQLCAAGSSSCVNPGTLIGGRYWAAVYPNQATVRVGFYPLDICYYVAYVDSGNGTVLANTYAQGCGDETTVIASGDSSAAISITAEILVGNVNSTIDYPTPTYSGTPSESAAVTLNFQNTAPTYSCSSDLSSIYFPGDTGILFNGSQVSATRATGGAPVGSVLIVGKNGSLPDTTSTNYTSNDVVRTAPIGIESLVTGFVNSTGSSDNQYDIAFSVQDQSGFVADFRSACAVNGVQTAQIQTFLQTNKCFIASSAFRNPSAIPVLILRDFRDQILLKTQIGKQFVDWYYEYSPEAALWLWVHSEYRYIVIALLSPLVLIAYLFINPEIIAVLAVGILLLGLLRRKNKKRIA